MTFLDHIRACNAHDLAKFRPFVVGGARVGWVGRDLASRLAAFTEVFEVQNDVVGLVPGLDSAGLRTAAVRGVLERLEAAAPGSIGLRGEDYAVATRFGGEPLMLLDRGAVALFGVRAYGIHVNGFVRGDQGLMMWVARRATDRAVAPGKLDNIVAGGQPAGLTLTENLIKEAAEEASIPAALASRAQPAGVITYCMEDGTGLKPDTQFCYDLEIVTGLRSPLPAPAAASGLR